MSLRVRPEDYPEGSAIRKQLEAADSETAKILKRFADDEEVERTGTRRRHYREHHMQARMVKRADQRPMATLIDRDSWPRDIVHSYLGEWLYHVPNGSNLTEIQRKVFSGLGLRAGVADLCIYLPILRVAESGELVYRGGLYIENKSEDGRLSDSQLEFRRKVLLAGYAHAEVRSEADFDLVVEAYFAGARCALPRDEWAP